MIFDRVDKGFDKSTISREKEIELNKQMSKTMTKIRASLKTGNCFYCGKPVNSYCNSHNVPRYCLENIGSDGLVSGPNAIYELPKMGLSIGKETPGINESGTFSLICRECDSRIFQEYENPANYLAGCEPSQKMLSQIAMKNYLKFIYKRKIEMALMENSLEKVQATDFASALFLKECRTRLNVSKLDLDAYVESFSKARKYFETGKGTGYYLIYYRLLDYVAPIAIQAPIVVSIDLDGNVINDVFNMNPGYEPKDLHVCVLPQKSTTAILLFVDYGDKRYSKFRRQFLKLDDESKLGVINYLIFLYSEDYFMSGEIQNIVDLAELNEIANITPVIWDIKPVDDTNILAEKFALDKWKNIPNLLAADNKLR